MPWDIVVCGRIEEVIVNVARGVDRLASRRRQR